MIFFSPAKINLGLQIHKRREDGFHNLQSVMFPIGLCDVLEIRGLSHTDKGLRFSQSGIRFQSDQEVNLCINAWKLFSEEANIPPVEIHLHKLIPVGAGLGGGSSNASTTLKGLNSLADMPLSNKRLQKMAAKLGSDCPFFLHNEPMLMEGKGEILSPVQLNLDHLHLVLLFPGFHVSTAEAYAGVTPVIPKHSLKELIGNPVSEWKRMVVNDFESSVFEIHPELSVLKQSLYDSGAIYTSLSGSGSSLYSLFNEPTNLPEEIERYVVWKGPAVGMVESL